MGLRGELFSTTVVLDNRTYFFNVKENRTGDLFLNVVESKSKEGDAYERHQIVLFADDMQRFLQGLNDSLKYMDKEIAGRHRKEREIIKARKSDDDGQTRSAPTKKTTIVRKSSKPKDFASDSEKTESRKYPPREYSSDKKSYGAERGGRKPAFGGSSAERSGPKDKKPYGSSSGDRKPYGSSSGDRKPYGAASGDRKPRSSPTGERKPYAPSGDRKPYGASSGDRKPYGTSADRKPSSAARKPYGTSSGDKGPRKTQGTEAAKRTRVVKVKKPSNED